MYNFYFFMFFPGKKLLQKLRRSLPVLLSPSAAVRTSQHPPGASDLQPHLSYTMLLLCTLAELALTLPLLLGLPSVTKMAQRL